MHKSHNALINIYFLPYTSTSFVSFNMVITKGYVKAITKCYVKAITKGYVKAITKGYVTKGYQQKQQNSVQCCIATLTFKTILH